MSGTKPIKVTVKHGKSKHKNVELDLGSISLEGLQAIIFSLTQVMPERQKIIIKGKQIENDDDASKIKNKATLVVMGSAETSISAISVSSKQKFMEDMTDKERQEVNAALPPGLYNLGNTCYLNSTLQCMKGIPELNDGLQLELTSNDQLNGGFSKQLNTLFNDMNSTSDSVNPTSFVQDFRTRFPEFATRNEQGVWEQQDADECLTKLLSTMTGEGVSVVNNLFSGEFESSMKCIESEDEPVVEQKETFLKLRCFIDSETRHISFGIEKSMSEEVEKRSDVLQRNARWIKTQRISKLPKYLTVSMVRFFWKQSKQKNAKILRSVQFDMKLDITNFCNDKLKAKIGKFRTLKMEAEDAIREKKQAVANTQNNDDKNNNDNNKDSNDNTESTANDIDMTGGNDNNNNNDNSNKNDTDEKKVDAMEIDEDGNENDFESGFYELVGLITHKGLSANSGHYIGYSKDTKRGWLKFDDDVVTEVKEDDIKKLYGGGQWQMGYVCFYRKVEAVIPKIEETTNESNKDATATVEATTEAAK